MLKYKNTKVIELQDWDKLVTETYGRPYCYQQQDGCMGRGVMPLTIPDEADDSEWPDSVPEIVNGMETGVKFSAWLARDPKQPIINQTANYELDLFWQHNFYPDLQMVANDLHKKGLIEAGKYVINIDW